MNNIKVSKDFHLWEFEDKRAGGIVKIDERLIVVLQEIRDFVDKPIKITSGFRTEKSHVEIYKSIHGKYWEDKISWNSQHLKGLAVDFTIIGGHFMDYMEAVKIAENSGVIKGIGDGVKKGFLHIDVRDSDSIVRWGY